MVIRRKSAAAKEYDLTQGGLFPSNWSCIGVDMNKKREKKKTVANRTTGKGKSGCETSTFARYCATRSRARKHQNYQKQVDSWNKGK